MRKEKSGKVTMVRIKNAQKRKTAVSLLCSAAIVLSFGGLAACGGTETDGIMGSDAEAATATEGGETASDYIEAPYQIDEERQGPTEYLEPVFYENENGPTIGVTLDCVIVEDGLYFKDSDNDGELDLYEDWRLDTDERVADLLTKMTAKQRVGLLVNQFEVGPSVTTADELYDENGNVRFDQLINVTPDALNADMSDGEHGNSTGEMLTNQSRAGVMRQVLDGTVSAVWVNSLQMICEYDTAATGEPTIPFTVISNPQDEITDAPAAQGFAAAVMGDVAAGGDYSLIEEYASTDREIWYAKGINRMFGRQIDLITDPRWPRDEETYTEVPEVMAGIATALTAGYQDGTDGVKEDGVALIIKHFPGDGASYNGFESHTTSGKYRLYPTEGSLENYQLVAFQAAIDAGAAGIMPGYSLQAEDGFYGSAAQSYRGTEIPADGVGNAYSSSILMTLLRDEMGFDGLVNTDSGVLLGNRAYGEESLSKVEAFAELINAGSDILSDQFYGMNWDIAYVAYNDGLIEEEALDRANSDTLKLLFEQGQFENPYKDPEESEATVEEKTGELQTIADELNEKSVVLLKNSGNVLPLNDTSCKVYIESFTDKGADEEAEKAWKEAFEGKGFSVVTSPEEADIAFFDVVPGGIGNLNAYVQVLDLVDDFEVDEVGVPDHTEKTGGTVSVTTLEDVSAIAKIAAIVQANGGIVISSIDISNPWILGNLEPYCDGMIASFTTTVKARMNVLLGEYDPTGKLPVTLPSCNEVIALTETTDELGNIYEACASPNDVPGYEKDQYMDEEVLGKSPSGSYAYRDADGNSYLAWFGLSYQEGGRE